MHSWNYYLDAFLRYFIVHLEMCTYIFFSYQIERTYVIAVLPLHFSAYCVVVILFARDLVFSL